MKRRSKLLIAALVTVAALTAVLWKPVARKIRYWDYEVSTGRFQDPEGLAIDSEGNLYVADEDWARITVLDPQGETLHCFQFVEGYEHEGQLIPVSRGGGIAVIEPGRILVIAQQVVLELDLSGEAPRLIRVIGEGEGTAESHFDGIEGIARDPETGDIYLTDEGNRRIQVFDAEGRFLRMFPVPEEPEGICLFGDDVFLSFCKANWVGRFSKQGKLLQRIGESGSGPGELDVPDFVCVSPDQLLYVTDQGNDRIQVFGLDGSFRFTIGSAGREPGQLREPEDLVFDSSGNLVAAEGANSRLQAFTPRGEHLRFLK